MAAQPPRNPRYIVHSREFADTRWRDNYRGYGAVLLQELGTGQGDGAADPVDWCDRWPENPPEATTAAATAPLQPGEASANLEEAIDPGSTFASAQAEAAESRAHDDEDLPPVGAPSGPLAENHPCSATMLLRRAIYMFTGATGGLRSSGDGAASHEAFNKLVMHASQAINKLWEDQREEVARCSAVTNQKQALGYLLADALGYPLLAPAEATAVGQRAAAHSKALDAKVVAMLKATKEALRKATRAAEKPGKEVDLSQLEADGRASHDQFLNAPYDLKLPARTVGAKRKRPEEPTLDELEAALEAARAAVKRASTAERDLESKRYDAERRWHAQVEENEAARADLQQQREERLDAVRERERERRQWEAEQYRVAWAKRRRKEELSDSDLAYIDMYENEDAPLDEGEVPDPEARAIERLDNLEDVLASEYDAALAAWTTASEKHVAALMKRSELGLALARKGVHAGGLVG